MNIRFLIKLNEANQMSVAEAMELIDPKGTSHKGLYPLSTLIAAEYVGLSYNVNGPKNTEDKMEYVIAEALHLLRVPVGKDGLLEYNGRKNIQGSMRAEDEWVFIKAKGQLYVDEDKRTTSNRNFTIGIALVTALVTSISTALLTSLTSP